MTCLKADVVSLGLCLLFWCLVTVAPSTTTFSGGCALQRPLWPSSHGVFPPHSPPRVCVRVCASPLAHRTFSASLFEVSLLYFSVFRVFSFICDRLIVVFGPTLTKDDHGNEYETFRLPSGSCPNAAYCERVYPVLNRLNQFWAGLIGWRGTFQPQDSTC